MPSIPDDVWTERLRETLRGYDDDLFRKVAGKLCKPRGQWPNEELISRCLETIVNPAVVDRRLKDLDPAGQAVLALIGRSRQQRWHLGNLVEMLVALGHADGLQPIQNLFEAGLLYPEGAGTGRSRLKRFELWLAQTTSPAMWVYAHPQVSNRALTLELPVPACPAAETASPGKGILEADGLEWPLRLSVLWQQVVAGPFRLTQQRDFFKRDLERLRGDPLLTSLPADNLGDLPDPGLLAVALARAVGLVDDQKGELNAQAFPEVWQQGLPATLASLWSALPHLISWNAEFGWQPGSQAGNPYPSAYLLSMLLLANLPDGAWARPEVIAQWVVENHPYWKTANSPKSKSSPAEGLVRFLLGFAYQLRMLQAAKDAEGNWLIRLSPLGRWLQGLAEVPPPSPPFPQTLLVQPNLEILVYRQGLSPDLIGKLARFAAWKNLGVACTMQLEADTVYRALEAGESFATLVQTLEQHSMKAMPAPVIEALKTWSSKRERISIYPAGALFEFADLASLQEAMARGLPAVRLTDRLAVVPNESAIDYRHFRLTATRDYCLPLEKCVAIEPDGVTLTVDLARSDLLLETELCRFAEPLPRPDPGRLQYRITPATMTSGRLQGLSEQELENWFTRRTGEELSPAARFLYGAQAAPAAHLRKLLVLRVSSAQIADGLQQWPTTAALIQDRLGPTALLILEEHAAALAECLKNLGMKVE